MPMGITSHGYPSNRSTLISPLHWQRQLVTVVGPKYKPYCLLYNRYPGTAAGLTAGDRLSSGAHINNRLLHYVSRVKEQAAAYYGQLCVVPHTSLEEALAGFGGNNLLLYMYAQVRGGCDSSRCAPALTRSGAQA